MASEKPPTQSLEAEHLQSVVVSQPQTYGAPIQQYYGDPGQPMYASPPGQQPYAMASGQQLAYGVPPGQHYMGPNMTQPQPNEWAQRPTTVPTNCPPGLEYLTQIDQILVHQQMEILEMFTGYETNNKYVVKNSVGQKVFYAAEDSGCCDRYWCNNLRHFEMNIFDNFGNEVIHIHRPFACQSCLYPCCLQKMEISSPPGHVIGKIEQEWSIFPKFCVKDENGDVVLRIEGPFFPCSCCGTDVVFDVFTRDGNKVGKITKQWTGFLREAVTDADVFGINFPMDLDVKVKATLLGACFLIDFMYFEDKQNSRNN